MESKFAHLSQRDNSVSMLRLKMSRRRSQTQKENRERTLNTRRQLEKVTELDASSVEASVAMTTTSVIHERTLSGAALAKSKKSKAHTKRIPLLISRFLSNKKATLFFPSRELDALSIIPLINVFFFYRGSSGRTTEAAWAMERTQGSWERKGKTRERTQGSF